MSGSESECTVGEAEARERDDYTRGKISASEELGNHRRFLPNGLFSVNDPRYSNI
jgi:hypothetical protein